MGEQILELRNVSSANGALKSVNIEVEKGDFFVVFAPSGSGKTTLLNLICRMEPLASGQISIKGVDIYNIEGFDKWRASNIGFVCQENNLIPTLTVCENVELPMLAARVDKEKRRERVLRALESVGLKEKGGLYPKKLDMEEEQRVALARAMAGEPVIILADEPTGKLKKEETQNLVRLMAELNEKMGNTFVVATHDYDFRSAASRVFDL